MSPAVAACLQQEIIESSKRYDCARYLLPNIPLPRRTAVVWRYLNTARVYGTGERLAYDAVLKHTLELGRKKQPDPALAALMLDVAERPSAGYVRNKAGVDRDFLSGGEYELEVACERVPAKLSLQPAYDPKSERVKA